MSEWLVDTRDLDKNKEYRLYISLPLRYGEDSPAIDQCLEELGIKLIDEENFNEVYQRVKEKMNEKYGRLPGVRL